MLIRWLEILLMLDNKTEKHSSVKVFVRAGKNANDK